MAQSFVDSSHAAPLVKYQELPSLPSEVRLETQRKLSTAMSNVMAVADDDNKQEPTANIITQWMTANAPAIIRDWLDANAENILRAATVTAAAGAGGGAVAGTTSVLPTKRKPNEANMTSIGGSAHDATSDDTSRYAPSQRSRPSSVGAAASHVSSALNEDDSVEPDPTALLNTRLRQRVQDDSAPSNALTPSRVSAIRSQHSLTADGASRSPPPRSQQLQQIQSTGRTPRAAAGPDVLLVEDVRVSQRIAAAALTRAHYKVEVASDGESAVDKYRQYAASLRIILMDIHLPGISGIEATQRIRKTEADEGRAPALVYGLTGNVEEANLRAYENAGMNGCIVKGTLLVDAVKTAVEMSERNPAAFVDLCQTQQNAHNNAQTNSPTAAPSITQSLVPSHGAQNNVSPQTPQTPSPLSTNDDAVAMSDSPPRPMPALSPSNTTNLQLPQPTAPLRQSSAPSVGPDLLLVEDVRVSQRIASQALQRAQFKVEVASDGESAVDKFKQYSGTVRVILMDVGLPGISGIEATEQIRRWERESEHSSPVLIFGLTGNVEEENLIEYEEVGMNGCILKGKLLVDAVRTAIDQSRLHPGEFINLVGKSDNAVVGSGGRTSQSPVTTTSKLSAREETDPADTDMTADSPPPASSASSSSRLTSSSTDAIGTPRALQPRHLLAQRFAGRGVVRPGVGLPSASASAAVPTIAASNTSASTSPSSRTSLSANTSASGPDVLLVEDVRVSQRITQSALSRAHYRVEVASDGESAVDKYKAFASSLRVILMDIGLPGISGVEATQRIRALEHVSPSPQSPVIIFGLTGNVAEANLRQYASAGMNGCIVKGRLLVDSVRAAIEAVAKDPNAFVNLSDNNNDN